MRVSHGACQACGKPILYQGATHCSPDCQGRAYLGRLLGRPRRSIDTETSLIRRGLLAPPLACVSWSNDLERGLVHHSEAREHVVRILNGDELLTGFNIAYDMTVFCSQWPDLVPLIFEVYAADRVSDTMWREKLRDIAEGTYLWSDDSEEEKVRLNYNLEEVAHRRCRIKLTKGTWQLRFGELIPVPMSLWPIEAQEYAVADAVANDAAWLDQEREDRERQERDGVSYFEDEFRQSRAYFWLQLMGCWGFHTHPDEVREFARRTQQNYERLRDELVHSGLVHAKTNKKGETKFTKKKKPVQDLVVQEKLAAGHKVPLTKRAEKRLELLEDLLRNEAVPARRASIEKRIKKCNESIVTNKDVCGRSQNPLLKKYADLSHYEHMLKSDVPLLLMGTEYPIQGRFDLANSGRTTSSIHFGKGNCQNWSTSNGMRECVEPRPGTIFAIGDYSGFELRTWSQCCLWTLGHTLMGQMLNQGMDVHLAMAARILNTSYEQAKIEFEADPKGRVYRPRQTSKVGNFGYAGGMGYRRLVEYARLSYNVILSEEEAFQLYNYWLQWPEAKPWLDHHKKNFNNGQRQVKYWVSNRYRGDLNYTEMANGFFQALAADAAKAAGFLIARACYADENSVLYGSRPVLFVHDEFVVEIADDYYAHDKAVELARLMVEGASRFLPDVPPVVEPLLARKWSKAAKPVHGQDGRLLPWEPKAKVAA